MTTTLEAPPAPRETPGTNATFALLEVKQLTVSETNPRRGITDESVAELAASVREHGIVEPILVRKTRRADRFEIVAGHRRFHAAKLAQLENVPCIVTQLDDQAALEIQILENLQRTDLTPIEEAEGYRQLITKYAYTAERIAGKIGMSLKYVYDRVKLLELIPESRELVATKRITAGHAILLARLSAADQRKAIDPIDGGVFEGDGGHDLFDGEEQFSLKKTQDPYSGMKPRSVRELEAWIDDRVRFKAEPKAVDPILFPETAGALAAAAADELKVIQITHDYHVREEARDGKVRTYGPQSWERADGQLKSKTCEHSVLGVVVVGPERGAAFQVCIAKEKCKTHWADWQRDRAKRAKAAASSTPSKATKKDKWQLEREREEARREAFKPLIAPLTAAICEAIAKAPAEYGSPLAELVLREASGSATMASEYLPKPKTAEDVLRIVVLMHVLVVGDWWAPSQLPALAKRFGVDVKKVAAAAGVQTNTPAAKPRKRGAKKGGKK